MDEFISAAHTSLTQITKIPGLSNPYLKSFISFYLARVLPASEIAGGMFPVCQGIVQTFVLRHDGKSHYRVYCLLKIGNEVQTLIWISGMTVVSSHLNEYKSMIKDAEPVSLILDQVKEFINETPLARIPSYPASPIIHKDDLPQKELTDPDIRTHSMSVYGIPTSAEPLHYRIENTHKDPQPMFTRVPHHASSYDVIPASGKSHITNLPVKTNIILNYQPGIPFFSERASTKDTMEGLYIGQVMGSSRL